MAEALRLLTPPLCVRISATPGWDKDGRAVWEIREIYCDGSEDRYAIRGDVNEPAPIRGILQERLGHPKKGLT